MSDLGDLAATLRHLAGVIAGLADDVERQAPSNPSAPLGEASDGYLIECSAPLLLTLAQHEYEARRRRTRHFDPDLFGEPAWDILLDLFVHECCGKQVSITSSAIASQVSQSTALRWLVVLEERGLICQIPSRTDARVTFVQLTAEGYRRIGNYLRERVRGVIGSKLLQTIPADS